MYGNCTVWYLHSTAARTMKQHQSIPKLIGLDIACGAELLTICPVTLNNMTVDEKKEIICVNKESECNMRGFEGAICQCLSQGVFWQ